MTTPCSVTRMDSSSPIGGWMPGSDRPGRPNASARCGRYPGVDRDGCIWPLRVLPADDDFGDSRDRIGGVLKLSRLFGEAEQGTEGTRIRAKLPSLASSPDGGHRAAYASGAHAQAHSNPPNTSRRPPTYGRIGDALPKTRTAPRLSKRPKCRRHGGFVIGGAERGLDR